MIKADFQAWAPEGAQASSQKITVVGTSNIGSAFYKQLSGAGHAVRITGRNTEKAKLLADRFPSVYAYIATEALETVML